MSTLNDILKKLNSLTTTVNSLISGAKSTDELPTTSQINFEALIRIFQSKTSYKITIDQLVDLIASETESLNAIQRYPNSGSLPEVGRENILYVLDTVTINSKVYFNIPYTFSVGEEQYKLLGILGEWETITGAQVKADAAEQAAKQYTNTELAARDIRIGEIEGLSLIANQANQEIYIKNASGETLSTLSVAFLNNEGTTFFYNETTENLELKNDTGEILSSIPVSAFVSNLAAQISLGGNQLDLKDTAGNVLSSVSFTISNIEGLQAALDNKVDKVPGKQLSDENYSLTEKEKLAGVEAGAEKNVPEADTLDSVAKRGNTTTEAISVGDFEATGLSNQSGIYSIENDVIRIINPKGATFHMTGDHVGTIKISLPILWTTDMVNIKVAIYNHSNSNMPPVEIICSGFNENSSFNWPVASARIIGSEESNDIPVRFGHDGVKSCIWLGELDSTWSFFSVAVTEINGHYNINPDNWSSGWNISLVTAFDTVQVTKTNNFPYGNWNKLKGKPTNLETTTGAQSKADAAQSAAISHADANRADLELQIDAVEEDVIVHEQRITDAETDISAKLDKTAKIQAMWTGTQAEYDAISTKSATTLYFIQ